jgi:hypothetical protein
MLLSVYHVLPWRGEVDLRSDNDKSSILRYKIRVGWSYLIDFNLDEQRIEIINN